MKALITAFALLSFVAASTIPLAAQAQTQTHAARQEVDEEEDRQEGFSQEEDRQEDEEAEPGLIGRVREKAPGTKSRGPFNSLRPAAPRSQPALHDPNQL